MGEVKNGPQRVRIFVEHSGILSALNVGNKDRISGGQCYDVINIFAKILAISHPLHPCTFINLNRKT
jgi:hypothetical protein